MAWFRVYDEIVDDPKILSLPDNLFRFWVNLMALTKRYSGHIPSAPALAVHFRTSEARVNKSLEMLLNRAEPLIEKFEGGLRPHNWAGRQYESDGKTSTERVRKHRLKHGEDVSWNNYETLLEQCRDVSVKQNETPSETDTETDTEQSRNRTEDSGLPFDTLGPTPEEAFAVEIRSTATRVHHRHPALRRDIGVETIERKLLAICRRKPKSQRFNVLRQVDENHKAYCLSDAWTKQGGEFAKSLENWLAPTMERWAVKPTSSPPNQRSPSMRDRIIALREKEKTDGLH